MLIYIQRPTGVRPGCMKWILEVCDIVCLLLCMFIASDCATAPQFIGLSECNA